LQFEIKHKEVVGRSIDDFDFLDVPQDMQLVREIIKKQAYIHGFEFRYKSAKGKTGWASGYVVKPLDFADFFKSIENTGLFWLLVNER
jgi:hypothetical protein